MSLKEGPKNVDMKANIYNATSCAKKEPKFSEDMWFLNLKNISYFNKDKLESEDSLRSYGSMSERVHIAWRLHYSIY